MQEKPEKVSTSDEVPSDYKSDGPEKDVSIDVDGDEPISQDPEGGFRDYLRIFEYADKLSWTLNIISFACSIGSGVTLPLMTIIFGNSVSEINGFSVGGASSAHFQSVILDDVLVFIYLFIARFFLSYIATLTISIAAIRITRKLRQKFIEATLRREIWHFDKHDNGAISVQVTTNGNRVNQGIADKLATLIQAVATFFAAFIVALAVQWKLALITMSVIPAIFFITGICVSIDARIETKIGRIYSRGAQLAEEALSSIRTVHAFWARAKMVEKYNEFLERAHKEGKKKSLVYAVMFSNEYFLIYSGIALAYWQGYRMYSSGEIPNVGKVFTVVFSTLIASTAISSITPQFSSFANAAAAASELFEILDKPSLLDPLSSEGISPACHGHIEVKNLVFAYPSRPGARVLKGLDISIPAGKTTALVGPSGCGKSTLVGLLERWYQPSSGAIHLDGVDVSEYNVKWLRSQMRLVQQEPVLFRGTVYENVANGFVESQSRLSNDERMDLVLQACKASNAHDFIIALPDGYNTELGERAGTLSGGQRQRIAIARSIISDPKILLLDEATSALDATSERTVQDALDRVSMNRTTLVIAHKLSTVKNAHNIAVISDGVVAEQGTHDDLLNADGLYAKLVAAQDLGFGDDDTPKKELAGSDSESESLQQTSQLKSSSAVQHSESEASGTLGYSLIRCIWIMLSEQKDLYLCQLISTVVCFIAAATFPGQALLISRVLEVFTLPRGEGQSQADFYSLMFFVVALGNLFAYFVIGINCNIISQNVTHVYRREMLANILKQDMTFFDLPENTSGALTSKLSSLPTQLQELMSGNLLLILIVVLNVVSSSALALAYGWKLGLVVIFGGFPPLLLSGYARIRLELKLEKLNADRFADSAGLANEAVSAIKTVSSLTLESSIIERYAGMLGGIVQKSIRSLLWTLFWYAISQSLEFLLMALSFWYGSQLLAKGEYNISQFYVITIGIIFAGQAAGQFFSYTTSITKATGAANYILWLRTLKPNMQEDAENRSKGPDGDDGSIGFSSLRFSYPQRSDTTVIKDLSMKITSGQFAAFVGPSGCGKSTMISLLERFYDPTSGEIRFASDALRDYSPRLYRQNVSLVQQEPTLFSGSVRENIALGLEGTDNAPTSPADTEARIVAACSAANALDFVTSLPAGLATPCGARGLQFSGGQKQRIAIARALIRSPRLLLLDEATSALDSHSERVVQAALDGAKQGRTTVAVAHRLSTIRHADVIFVFAAGAVVESGTHAQLVAARGAYYAMCAAQRLDQAV